MEGDIRNFHGRDTTGARALGAGWSRDQALEFIAHCYDRDALLHTLLGFSTRWMAHRMILVLGNQQAQPYLLQGWPGLDSRFADPEVLRQIRVSLPADAPFFQAEQADRTYTARPEDVALGTLFVELCLFPPERLFIQSILIGKRPAMTLLGEVPPGAMSEPGSDLEDLAVCARAVGEQLTELVHLAKANQLPPSDARIPALPHSESPIESAHDESPEEPPGWFSESLAEAERTEAAAPIAQRIAHKLRKVGSTAYGLPFVDHSSGETLHLQNVEATAFGLPFVDGEDAGRAVEVAPSDQTSGDHLQAALAYGAAARDDEAPENASRPALDAQSPPPGQSEEDLTRITWDGGFSVTEFERGLLRAGAHVAEGAQQEAQGDDFDSGDRAGATPPHDTPPPSARVRQSTAPRAQILRPRSLKHGRQSRDTGAETPQPRAAVAPDARSPMPHADRPQRADASDTPAPTAQPSLDFEAMREQFPGALHVDRYQYTVETLPPVDRHSQLLADMVAAGDSAVELASSFLEHHSVELRFYATMLFSRLPVEMVVEQIIPRLFDRDYQTREIARNIILDYRALTRARGEDWFEASLCLPLREIILDGSEDIRLETAADLLGTVRCAGAVDALIAGLDRYRGRVKNNLGRALRAITYKDFPPSHSEWLNWRSRADTAAPPAVGRAQWIIDALNADSPEIRQLVYEEIREMDGLVLNYHPDQPAKLRIRAQNDLREWFDAQAPHS